MQVWETVPSTVRTVHNTAGHIRYSSKFVSQPCNFGGRALAVCTYSPGYHPSSALGFVRPRPREGDNQGRNTKQVTQTGARGSAPLSQSHDPQPHDTERGHTTVTDREELCTTVRAVQKHTFVWISTWTSVCTASARLSQQHSREQHAHGAATTRKGSTLIPRRSTRPTRPRTWAF